MPAPTSCDINTLIGRAKCLSKPCLGSQDWEGIEIYARIAGLAAAGGADYTSDPDALFNAAKAFQVVPGDTRKAIDLLFSLDAANDNGATVSYDPNVLKAKAAGYISLGTELQKQLNLFLKCALTSLDKPS
jgi:hypothetical protein